MKAFKIVPSIAEYMDFRTLAKELNLGARDLILTNEYIYNPTIAALNLGCHTCFQEKFGGGEPTDVMVDAILDDLRGKEFDRIIAVGGGTVIDIAKVLTVAKATDRVDDLYDRMANLEKEHELIIVPTTCGTGSEVTNISIINRTTKGVKVGLVSPGDVRGRGGARARYAAQPAVSGVRDFFHRCDGPRGGELSLSECVCTERAVLRQGAAPHPVLLEGRCCSGRQGCVEEACT